MRKSIVLLFAIMSIHVHLMAQTQFVVLNDSTVFCKKNDTGIIIQLNNGKVRNKGKAAHLLNIPVSDNDTLFWNTLRKKIKAPLRPQSQIFVFYPSKANPDGAFIWFIKNKNGIHWISSQKTANESNFFSVDQLVAFITGQNKINYKDSTYRNIIRHLAGYTNEIQNSKTAWKAIRDALRNKLNTSNYSHKVLNYKHSDGRNHYIFVSQLPVSHIIPTYRFDAKLKALNPPPALNIKSTDRSSSNGMLILFFLSGILFTLLLLVALYFASRKKILPLLISKNVNHIQSGIRELIKTIAEKYPPKFKEILDEFNRKFAIYEDVTTKLGINNKITETEAFQDFMTAQVSKMMRDANNVKTLLEIDKYSNAHETVKQYQNIFKQIGEYIFHSKESIDNDINKLPGIIKNILEKLNACQNENNQMQTVISQLQGELKACKEEKNNLDKELKMHKDFRDKIQHIFEQTRNIENEILRHNVVKGSSNDEKNNIIFYLMQLQTVLNLLFSKASDGSNFNNLAKNFDVLKVGDVKAIKDSISMLNQINLGELALNVPEGDMNLLKTIYGKVFHIFNREVDDFPSPFYFGIYTNDEGSKIYYGTSE